MARYIDFITAEKMRINNMELLYVWGVIGGIYYLYFCGIYRVVQSLRPNHKRDLIIAGPIIWGLFCFIILILFIFNKDYLKKEWESAKPRKIKIK